MRWLATGFRGLATNDGEQRLSPQPNMHDYASLFYILIFFIKD